MKAIARYLGAKNALADWIIRQFRSHRCYVEPFGGSAGVLLSKPPVECEVYNDVFDDVVNLMAVIRSEEAGDLANQVYLTPYAEIEYKAAMAAGNTPLEQARRFLVRSFMAVSTDGVFRHTSGFRRDKSTSGGSSITKWQNLPSTLLEAHDRLRNVTILNQDAIKVILDYDSEETLFYLDPPYLPDTRTEYGRYSHEYTWEQHEELLALLPSLKGDVVISCYDHDLYASALRGWYRVEIDTQSMRQAQRKEVIYRNFEVQPLLPF